MIQVKNDDNDNNKKISETEIINEHRRQTLQKVKDIKKIQRITAKYKNKSLDTSGVSIGKNKIVITNYDEEENKVSFTTNSLAVHNENPMVPVGTVSNYLKSNEKPVMMTFTKQEPDNRFVEFKYEPSQGNNNNTTRKEYIKQIPSDLPDPVSIMPSVLAQNADEKVKLSFELNSIDGKINTLKQKLYNSSNLVKIKISQFLSIQNQPNVILNILQFLDTNDLFHILNTNKLIRKFLMNAIVSTCKQYITNTYDAMFTDAVEDTHSSISVTRYKKNRKAHCKINIVIQSKITSNSKITDNSVHMRYGAKFFCDKCEYVNNFIFDVKKPGPLLFWVMKEYTAFHQDDLNKAYFQHIMQFSAGDFIELNINIFTEKGLMDIIMFRWYPVRIFPTPKVDFLEFSNEHNKKREIVDFDLSRFCELEILKNKWTDLAIMTHYESILSKIKKLFEPTFLVKKILYDDVGYYLFKVYLLANQKGLLASSDELGIKIEVMGATESLINEVKKNNLIFDRKNEMKVRLGDILVFYISKNK